MSGSAECVGGGVGAELERLRAENARLRTLLTLARETQAVMGTRSRPRVPDRAEVSSGRVLSAAEKVALVRRLFRGREDVYAVRWEGARSGKAGYAPAVDGQGRRLPLSDGVVERHLRGQLAIGVYPLRADGCSFSLALDLDGGSWQADVDALLAVCAERSLPVLVERSRSGDGAHLWIFFAQPVSAREARRLGSAIVEAARERTGLELASFDRMFPSQDGLAPGALGNLIALPLQGTTRKSGCGVFLDPVTLEPYADQWAVLDAVERVERETLDRYLIAFGEPRGVRSAGLPVCSANGQSNAIACVVGAELTLAKSGVPTALLAELRRLASIENPLFHERQRLRLSIYRTPRWIRCYEEDRFTLRLPRGLQREVEAAAEAAGSHFAAADERPDVPAVAFAFDGRLTGQQDQAVAAMLKHDTGVLVAPPGVGKTVIGCRLIAARAVPTLVLVHRKPLLDQWRSQLQGLLGLDRRQVGQVGGGQRRQSGVVDVAMLQSLRAIDDLAGFFREYGQIVVDECHHLPAATFDSCIRHASSRYLVGLTATPYRRDGLERLVTMRVGPVRHRIATADGPAAGLSLRLVRHETALSIPGSEQIAIQQVFRRLVDDTDRTALVCDHVVAEAAEGRRCLVLSQWKEHCELLVHGLEARAMSPHFLAGGLGKRARQTILDQIAATPAEEPLVVVATGQYLGEGFDCAQLDSLFIAFPISFKGRLVQYTGRLMRTADGKTTVRVHDYDDRQVPVLRAMHQKRLATYRNLGFPEARPTRRTTPHGQLAVAL